MKTSRNVPQWSVNEAINTPIGIYKQTSSPNSNPHDILKRNPPAFQFECTEEDSTECEEIVLAAARGEQKVISKTTNLRVETFMSNFQSLPLFFSLSLSAYIEIELWFKFLLDDYELK